ncbi:MAG: phosphoribosylanthranilate isomerase [Elusimicrobia bacterium]|nr:phosphoribosylanthranilate isomerase [Elusimicrobiota bacterium]
MVKVKMCGVTNYDDALLITNAGAEYIGFNFVAGSARKISDKLAKTIIEKLPPFVTPVGIFVNEDPVVIAKYVKKCNLKMVQLHGDETPEYCSQLHEKIGVPVIKAFRMENDQMIDKISRYADAVQYYLLDSFVAETPGGTGEVFDWDMALKVKELGKPVFLAGGLTPDNVAEAIKKVMPFAVDVASGVERIPRRKDYDRMNQFMRKARGI